MTKINLYIHNVAKYGPVDCEYQSYKVYKDAKNNVADIYVIALQEVPNIEVSGVVVAQKTWCNFITKMLNDCDLTLVYRKYMLSNLVLVFGDLSFLKMIQKIQTRSVKYSFKGTLGYKGTLGVHFKLRNNKNLIFLTSHFTHGDENTNVRCKEYEQGKHCMFEDLCDKEPSLLFWMGDFNSRISDDSTLNCTLASKTDKNLFNHVCENDQLHVAKKEKQMFVDFHEPNILFPPTYRLIIKTDVYDIARRPSWCDRILVKTWNIDFKNLEYNVDINVLTSDHLPVFALYDVKNLLDNNAISNSCIFQTVPWWTSSVYFMCYFHFVNDYYESEGSRFDWIGFYKYPIKNILLPEYWLYMAVTYECDVSVNDENIKKKYVAEASRLAAGEYIAGYYSASQNACIGFSNVFTVKDS